MGKIVFKLQTKGISFVELCVFSFNRNAFLEHPQFIQSPFILALREAWIIVVYGAGMVTISYLRLSHCEPRYKQIEEETNKKTFSIDDHGKLITDGRRLSKYFPTGTDARGGHQIGNRHEL